MSKAPTGANVGLYVDMREPLELFDIIETPTGRRYAVVSVRVQQRGKHRGRQHLRCIVLGLGEEPPCPGRTFTIHWYERVRGKRLR